MTPEDRLRSALRAAAGPVAAQDGADRLLAIAGHRRRRRVATVSSLAVAALLAVGGLTVLADDEASRVRTGPATTPTPTTTEGGPPSDLVAIDNRGGVGLYDEAGRLVRVLAPAGSATNGRVARGADGWVYYAPFVPCGEAGGIHRVRLGVSRPPERIADGAAPALSPDGLRLAFAARWTEDARDPAAACQSTVIVRDLVAGTERRFAPTENTNSFIAYGNISAVDWAPDGRRIAFQMGWEGEGSYVLDTVAHRTTRDAEPLGSDLTANGMMVPTWHPPSGRIAAVSDCCYELDGPKTDTPQPTLLIDPATKASTELLDGSVVPKSLDYDPTGRYLLYVDKAGALFVLEEGSPPRRLGTGFAAAAW